MMTAPSQKPSIGGLGPMLRLPPSERPRERLCALGPKALSDAELIAILIGFGAKGLSALQLAHLLLTEFQSLEGIYRASVAELAHLPGIGQAKAVRLQAALALGKRLSHGGATPPKAIASPEDAYSAFLPSLADCLEERVAVLPLDAKGVPLGLEVVSIGTLTETLAHPREIFFPAIKKRGAALLIAHNHPSGDPTPSEQDIRLTCRLLEAGRLLGIPLRDHLILGKGSFVSLREEFQNRGLAWHAD